LQQQHDTNSELSAVRAELTEAQRMMALGAEEKTRLLRAVSAAEAGLAKAKRAAYAFYIFAADLLPLGV
jgi:hypothetical protein